MDRPYNRPPKPSRMRSPLDQFAERIIRNNEVSYFIQGLLDLGVSPTTIELVVRQRSIDEDTTLCPCKSGKFFYQCCGVTKDIHGGS